MAAACMQASSSSSRQQQGTDSRQIQRDRFDTFHVSKHRGFSQIQENSGKFRVAVLIWKFLLAAETYGDSGSTTPNIVEFAVTHKLRYLNLLR